MAIKSVIKMGNQQLATPSLLVVDFSTTYLDNLINDMKDTMKEKGGVGIAAPQIGCNLRVVIFGFDCSERYPDEQPVPFTVLINPVINILSEDRVDGWEGCLSVPGLRGCVPRYKHIQYSGYDQDGNPISQIADGFHARVVQHECDHIDGILFPQRLNDLRLFGFEDELSKGSID
jgi:peptide deformylase